jgi:ParB family chromosome partitioning protein
MEKKALGKGLAALIGEKQAEAYQKAVPLFSEEALAKKKGDTLYLEINKIKRGRLQPREEFDSQKLQELISSVKEKGVLQPILVRKSDTGFEIIAGERRFRAAQALHLDKIPAIIKDVKDDDALVISLVENIQREGLNPIEEAHAFQQLLDKFNFSQDDIAQAVGKDKTTISNILRLLKLPPDIQRHIAKGEISLGHAKLLLATEDAQKQRKLCQMVISNSLSVRELENLVNVSLPQRKRKAIAAKTTDPYVLEFERILQLALGTKVKILAHKKRGKILIEYYSAEDLERIIGLIKKK